MSSVAFDADGVILDFIALFRKIYKKLYNEDFVILPNKGSASGRFEDISDVPTERILKVVKYCITDKDLILSTPFMEGAKNVLNTMFKNKSLYIITKRPIETADILLDHFYKNLPNVSNIEVYCTFDPFDEKLQKLRDLKCNYFIDDRLETCCYFWKKGIHAILFKSIINRVFINVVKREYNFFPSVLENWNETELFLKTIL